MEEKKATRWYTILKAEKVIFMDPETGTIRTQNLIMLETSIYRTIEYPRDGIKRMLLKVGDRVKFENDNTSIGKILLV